MSPDQLTGSLQQLREMAAKDSILDSILRAADSALNANPLRQVIPVDWAEFARALRTVWLRAISRPERTMAAAADFNMRQGQPAHEAGVKLQRVIKRTWQYLFVFVTNRDIPATNNGSERALRPCVVFRKITNGFRTEWGANLYADIRSVIETARRRSIGALEAIRLTLAGASLVQST